MSYVAVSDKILQWALDRSGRSVEDLEKRLPRLVEWLAGDRRPTLRQLEVFSKATSTPFGMLFLEHPPKEQLPIPHFRTVTDEHVEHPSPDLIETIQIMQRRQAWIKEFSIKEGVAKLPFVGRSQIDEKPEVVAKRIRKVLGLRDNWASKQSNWTIALRHLRDATDESGILVAANGIVGNNTRRKLDTSEFRGFVLVDKHAPLVFVNASDYKSAQLFTLAHEIAHVFFGSSAAFDLRQMMPAKDKTELACNRVAAEFLVPEVELRKAWQNSKRGDDTYDNLAYRFKVSTIVIARRALDLRLISKKSFFKFYDEYTSIERKKADKRSSGGDFYAVQGARIGTRFGETVVRAVREGKLLYSDAYSLTGLHGSTFENYSSTVISRGAG